MADKHWKYTHTSKDNTHHVDLIGKPLYSKLFRNVLPFHEPGIAPVLADDGAYHINLQGEAIYSTRFKRTFGFYEGFSAVIDTSGLSFHIGIDGKCIYREVAKKFDWCGNFQEGRCVVRASSTSKVGINEYYHIGTNGEFIQGGPYEYAGDYREGSAVVRDKNSGLCYHVDLHGSRLYSYPPGFVDLDVFHKGFARAKDARGWFHINTSGQDISDGSRYQDIEPFYNGMAHAKKLNGERVVIDESYLVATRIQSPLSEFADKLHSLCVAYWPSFALKLGLEMGFADKILDDLAKQLPHASFQALQAAWLDIGLMEIKDNSVVLSEMGKQLKLGSGARDRADYWLGPQLYPWLNAKEIFGSPPTHANGKSFFDQLTSHSVDLCQRVLYSYAEKDWAEVVNSIQDFSHVNTVVDIGGGFGFLAKSICDTFPHIKCIVVEKPEVVASVHKHALDRKIVTSGVEFVVGDLFSGSYPPGDMYILSRVLHDWSDEDALKILRHIHSQVPPTASLLILERHKTNLGSHGLLQLNMLLVTGGTERTAEEFSDLFTKSGWIQKSVQHINSNCVATLLGKKIQ